MTFRIAFRRLKAGVWVMLAVTAACSSPEPGPEAEVRAWLEEAESFAQERKIRRFAELIDPDYQDSRGNDRDELLRQLRLLGFVEGRREIVVTVESLLIGGSDAADVQFLLRFADIESGRGFNTGQYQVKLELRRKSNGEWTLLRAQWARAGERLQ